MIKIKELPDSFKNADAETRRQMWEINVAEALKSAATEADLNLLTNAVGDSLDKLEKELRKELANKANKSELHKHESQLEVKPKKEEQKQPSLLSQILEVIKNRKK